MPYDILSDNIPFAIGEVQTSKRGQKFAPITVDGQGAKLFQLTDLDHALYCPFGCGVYQERGDETRVRPRIGGGAPRALPVAYTRALWEWRSCTFRILFLSS